MPDGQMKSHLLRVYTDQDITEADKPELLLLAGQLGYEKLPSWGATNGIHHFQLARFQQWTETIDGVSSSHTGTLLIFDLRTADFAWFKACMRVTPVLKWSQSKTAVGSRPVYIGNMLHAGVWTALIMAILLVVFLFRFLRPNGWKCLLLNPEGRLSLSKTQAAAWTLCIGAMVFCFGITRLRPPVIPETLVALMGLSLATRALVYTQEKKSTVPPATPEWGDLIRSFQDGKGFLAITKAQMLFWTCIVIFLFCTKSLLDGELWDVPWQLVALMGMSQASYMVPKVKEPKGESPWYPII